MEMKGNKKKKSRQLDEDFVVCGILSLHAMTAERIGQSRC